MSSEVTEGPKRKGNCQTAIVRINMMKLKLEKPRVHVLINHNEKEEVDLYFLKWSHRLKNIRVAYPGKPVLLIW